MNKALLMIVLFAVLPLHGATSQELDFSKLDVIFQTLKTRDKAKIAALFTYPIPRAYPIKGIQNEADFVGRFDRILDDAFIDSVLSSIQEKNVAALGWRGYCVGDGELWIDENYKLCAVNHQTEQARLELEQTINADKLTLPPNMRDYDAPVLSWNKNGLVFRVDSLKDQYRLLVLNQQRVVILELDGGTVTFDGNMGDHFYEWDQYGVHTRIDYSVATGAYTGTMSK